MRINIKVNVDTIAIKNMAEKSASVINKLLGTNHQWHDLERKPYTCSFIKGGRKVNDVIVYDNDAYIYVNTDDSEVITALLSDENIVFSIEKPKIRNGSNILSVKRVIYNTNGKKVWVTNDNKTQFEEYLKMKYGVSGEILKMNNSTTHYKNHVILNTTDLLIRCFDNTNVMNLFESGIGGSCSIGFGFVETINKD